MFQSTSVSPWLGASLASVRSLMPGIGLALVLALSATFVSEHYGGPKYLYALLMGMAFHHLLGVERYTAGIEFSAKKLVRVGVALLGLRIMVGDLHDLGVFGAVALAGGLVSTILFGMWCAKRLGLPKSLGILSGGGTGICGISATLAIAATLPPSEEVEQMTLLSAIGIATLSTLAMVTYPLLVAALDLSTTEAGFMLGGSIHDVAQVVGAGYIISPDVADFATLSKMFRVAIRGQKRPLAGLIPPRRARQAQQGGGESRHLGQTVTSHTCFLACFYWLGSS